MTDDKQKYPAWRFHPDHPARIVQNADEDKSLGKGWLDSHLKLPKPKEPAHVSDAAATPEPAPAPTSPPPPPPPPDAPAPPDDPAPVEEPEQKASPHRKRGR